MKYQATQSSEGAAGPLCDLHAEMMDAPSLLSFGSLSGSLKVPVSRASRRDDTVLDHLDLFTTNGHSGLGSGTHVPSNHRQHPHDILARANAPSSYSTGTRISYQAILRQVLSFPKKIFSTRTDFYCFKTNISKCDCTVHRSVRFVLSCNPETYHYHVLCEQSWAWLACD